MDTIAAVLANKARDVKSISPTAWVIDAVMMMNAHGIGSVAVVEGGRLVGIFTERDVLVRIIVEQRDPQTTRVAEVMTENVVTVPPTMVVSEAMGIMTDRRKRHLPVMLGGTMVGLVSIGDLMRWVIRDREVQIEDLVAYISHA